MELFVDGTAPESVGPDGLGWRDGASYVEVKAPVDGGWIPLYLVETPAASVALTCWGDLFDADVERLRTPAWEDELAELRPTWCRCLEQTLDGRQRDGALLRLEDPDEGQEVWAIGVAFTTGSRGMAREAEDAMDAVTRLSTAVADELEQRPGTGARFRAGARSLRRARSRTMVEDLYAAARWLPAPGSAPDRT